MAMGSMPKIMAAAVISMARRRPAGAFARRIQNGLPVVARALGEGDQQNRIRHGDSDRHDGAHERLNVQRSAGDQQHQTGPRRAQREPSERSRAPAARLKIRREQQKNHQHGQQQADAQTGEGLLQRRESRRCMLTLTPLGGAPARRHGLVQFGAASPSVMP